MYADHDSVNGVVILLFDAHKAFNKVEWFCMLESLHRFGFGETFISLVKLMYVNPCSILTKGDRSIPFILQCSVQQGCPLSPVYLFTIALEQLAIQI